MAIKKFNANSVSGGLVSGATVSSSAPSAPSNGALWLNSSTGALLTYYDSGSNTQWLQPVSPTGAVGATGAAGAAGAAGAPGEAGVSVVISSIVLTDSSYATITDTSLSLTGGYIRILGTGFVSGCTVVIDNSVATSVTFVNSTEIRAQLPAKVAGTYILYASNPSGAVAIRVNAITFSATPSWVTTSPLSGSINVPVSIQLSVASDSTVSYVLQAGSTLPTGLTLSSSGLLSGTVTGITLLTTYNFTIVATDLESQTSPKAFSITISVSEPYFNSTVLLLQGDVTPFTADASTNKFEISPVGTPSANINNPLQPIGYYSAYFNGTSGLNVPDSAGLRIMSGDTNTFIAEGWFYFLGPIAGAILFDKSGRNGISFTNWTVQINASSQIQLYWSQSGSPGPASVGVVASTVVPTLNMWYHIAFVKSSADWAVFANGTRIITYSGLNSANDGNPGPLGIGQGFSGAVSGSTVVGYISNVRVYNSTAVGSPYSATSTTLTVPTAPLTAIPGTMLLILQNNYFKDNSSINATIALLGQVSINVAQPFVALSAPYTGYGSGLFNGSGDSIYSNVSAAGAGSFTYEAWVYPLAFASNKTIFRTDNIGSLDISLLCNSTGQLLSYDNSGTLLASTTTTLQINTWAHVALVRNGTAMQIYINGVASRTGGSGTFSNNITYTQLDIGGRSYYSDEGWNGYITNARYTKLAVYTGAFTPPTDPLTTTQSSSGNIAAITGTATSLLTLQNNQSQNNNQFRDSSNSNFTITRGGTPTQGTFTPFSQTGWSGYFNSATSDYLSNSSIGALGSGSFTIELWVYTPSVATDQCFIGNCASTGFTNWQIDYISGTTLRFLGWYDVIFSVAVTLPINSWNHIAVSRNGTNCAMFLNGTRIATPATDSHNYSITLLNIGREADALRYYTGYLSNVRIVTGTYVYNPTSTTITVPTSPLTAISGTTLLTLQDNRFKDNSSNTAILTVFGTPSIRAFSPFAPSTAYSTTLVGGSGYFNGTTDYLTVPSNSALDVPSGDFTIEGWIYPTAAGQFLNKDGAYSVAFPQYALSISGGNKLQLDAGAGNQSTTASTAYVGTTNITYNNWHHFAAVRTGTTIKLFLDGNQEVSTAQGQGMVSGGRTLDIALNRSSSLTYLQIYISNLRIVKGTAVYTATFTPPTAPLTAIAGTSLLLNATNAGIFDATGKNDLSTVGDARVSTSVTKYGSGAMYFDGTGDSLTVLSSAFFNFGTVDFTIECWVYPITISTSVVIIDTRNSDVMGAWDFNIQSNSKLDFIYGASRLTSTTSISTNVWTHIAVTRASGVIRLFINGVVETTTATYSSAIDALSFPSIGGGRSTGANSVTGYYFNGYIDDLRVTKYARYTTTFTPPASAALKQ